MSRRLAVLILLLSAGASPAATIHVPGDATTILAGVDMAAAGDTVLVGPGVWSDFDERQVLVFGHSVTLASAAFLRGGIALVSEQGPDDTTIAYTGGAVNEVNLLAFHSQPGAGAVLVDGFTVTGVVEGFGANATGGDLIEFRSCRFIDNQGRTDGVYASAINTTECDLWIADCEFVSNQATGKAVYAGDANLTAERCVFVGNDGGCVAGDGYAHTVSLNVSDCVFRDNRGGGLGVCIDGYESVFMHVSGCLFERNVTTYTSGSAVRVAGGNGTIEFCTFAYDSALVSNAGAAPVQLEDAVGVVRNNTFLACHSALDGAAFAAVGSSVWLENNVFAHTTGGAAVRNVGSTIHSSSCNIFWANEGGDFREWPPGPTDLFADPLFCDWPNADYTVQGNSPCAPAAACAGIGAWGVECEGVAVEAASWGRIKGWYRD